jgi:hypothetical protein
MQLLSGQTKTLLAFFIAENLQASCAENNFYEEVSKRLNFYYMHIKLFSYTYLWKYKNKIMTLLLLLLLQLSFSVGLMV